MKIITIAAAGVLVLGLTGCSAVADLIHSEQTWDFDDQKSFAEEWPRAAGAEWVPDDAELIQVRESLNGEVGIIGLTSSATLDEVKCVETERLSGPSFTDDWAPEKVYVDTIFACGDWAVMKTDDGWFGWTPSAPGEQEVAPAP